MQLMKIQQKIQDLKTLQKELDLIYNKKKSYFKSFQLIFSE